MPKGTKMAKVYTYTRQMKGIPMKTMIIERIIANSGRHKVKWE